jgi:hypothetical protein
VEAISIPLRSIEKPHLRRSRRRLRAAVNGPGLTVSTQWIAPRTRARTIGWTGPRAGRSQASLLPSIPWPVSPGPLCHGEEKMKSLVTQLIALLVLTVACVAGSNSPSYLVATNEADFARLMKVNRQRTQKGLQPLPIQLSPKLDKKLVSDGALPSLDQEPQSVSLRFKNVPLSFVLEEYTDLTGKKVLIEKGLSVPVTVATETPVSKAEAVALIEKALSVEGIILKQVDTKTLKALRKPRQEEAQQENP